MMQLISAKDQRETFKNLYSLYVYDLTEGTPMLGGMINAKGMYEPPHGLDETIDTTDAYVIMSDDKPVGIVNFIEGKEADYCVQEIFIIRPFRRKGIATDVINNYLSNKHGSFMVHILKGSTDAISFFESYFKEKGMEARREERDAIAWNYFTSL